MAAREDNANKAEEEEEEPQPAEGAHCRLCFTTFKGSPADVFERFPYLLH